MLLSSRVRKATTFTLAVGWAVLMYGCAAGANSQRDKSVRSSRPTAVETINDTCPISGLPVRSNAPVAFYQGLAVGFCGKGCVRPWMMRSDQEKRELIAQVASDARTRAWGPPPRNPFR